MRPGGQGGAGAGRLDRHGEELGCFYLTSHGQPLRSTKQDRFMEGAGNTALMGYVVYKGHSNYLQKPR